MVETEKQCDSNEVIRIYLKRIKEYQEMQIKLLELLLKRES